MSADQIADLTPKGQRTRALILDSALALFAENGYAATTMRDIAARAGCSLGLAYRYYARKEDLILAFYERCALELEEEVQALPPAPLAKRFEQAMRADLRRVAPYRAAFGALFGVALTPESDVAVLGERVSEIRERVWRIFLAVIEGATDAPKARQAKDLATIFYAAHLGMILFWLQDRTPGQRATEELLVLAREMVGRLRPALRIPLVSRPLARLARVITPMFGPANLSPSLPSP